ncbi:MAG: hypothetical protein ACE5GW_07400 [Planctomycetota bacterium]
MRLPMIGDGARSSRRRPEAVRHLRSWGWLLCLLAVSIAAGCDHSGTQGRFSTDSSLPPLILSAGSAPLQASDPGAREELRSELDLDRIELAGEPISELYELTTPAGEAFAFHLISMSPAGNGAVTVEVAHAREGSGPPPEDVSSLGRVGIIALSANAEHSDRWLRVHGDGFARLTLMGAIEEDQVLAVRSLRQGRRHTALVSLRIGPPSEISIPSDGLGDYAGVLDSEILYSSDSWRFSLPTVAVSGDRLSVVVYEGDQLNPWADETFELRMQVDLLSGGVTGGGTEETTPFPGNWRDHEIAALYNVLAVVRSGHTEVTLRISFDRGTSFEQEEAFGAADPPGSGPSLARLSQVAIAADYTLAVTFWRALEDGVQELVLIEGTPDGFDPFGPTGYSFAPPEVIYTSPANGVPEITGVRYSEGGDLVIAYAFFTRTYNNNGSFTDLTRYRCAVRLYGEELVDVLVDEDESISFDPSVSLVGSGATMRIFYAYETRQGIRLSHSADGGLTFSPAFEGGDGTAALPSVFARPQGGGIRVDLLYLRLNEALQELHLIHWDDFDQDSPGEHRLTHSSMMPSAQAPITDPTPGGGGILYPPAFGYRITQVAWFGYDATLDGDDVLVVYDEQTFDSYYVYFMGGGGLATPVLMGMGMGMPPFQAAEPPPLAPGMTEPLPGPDPSHQHQLRMLRLD